MAQLGKSYEDVSARIEIEGAPLPFLRKTVEVDACSLLQLDSCVLPATNDWETVTVSGNVPAAPPAFPGAWCGRITLLSSTREEIACAAFNIELK